MREGFASALSAVDDLLDETCAEHSMKREEAVVAGFSQGGGLAFALGLGRNDRPHPAGVLAMSPFVRLELVDVDWEAAQGHSRPAPARHRRPDDQGHQQPRAGPAPRRARRAPRLRRVPDGPRGRARERAAGARLARRHPRRRAAVGAAARAAAGEPGEAGDHRGVRHRGARVRRPGDRRLLGALVRPLPPGRARRRADRGRCARARTRSSR